MHVESLKHMQGSHAGTLMELGKKNDEYIIYSTQALQCVLITPLLYTYIPSSHAPAPHMVHI